MDEKWQGRKGKMGTMIKKWQASSTGAVRVEKRIRESWFVGGEMRAVDQG